MMGVPVIFRQDLNIVTLTSSVLSVLLIYFIGTILYNIYLHPLAKIPGPLLWRASRLGFIHSLLSGTLVVDVKKLHGQYGDVVRTAPDEVSFAREDAWHDIFSVRPGHKPFLKDPVFFQSPPGQPPNLVTVIDVNENARMRQLLMPAFTDRALLKQEPTIQFYTSLMVSRLRELVTSPENDKEGTIINVVDWFNWLTFDVIGELSLGESFGCLKDTKNHPWVSLIFNALKMFAVGAATRYYPGLESFLMRLVPASVMKMQQDHYAFALEKIHRRMNLATQRDDFMTPILENNRDFEIMNLQEVESTMGLLLIAGSETTGTTLCGITNYLVQTPLELQKLEEEIRTTFKNEEDITLRAIQDLPFLNAVIHEGLRLCNPVAGGVPRIVPEGGGDTVSGYFLPGGTHITVNPTALSRSEANFHRAEEFLPDRFLPDDLRPAEFEMDQRSNQKPFGLGGRFCPGKLIAWAEMRLVLARMVWNLDLSMAPGKQINWMEFKTYVVVQKEPINVRIKARPTK